MTDQEYIQNLVGALKANPDARELYFPPDREERKRMNLRLARDVGHGLTGSDWGFIYSALFVRFSFDTTGVCVDARDIINEIRKVRNGKLGQ